MRSKSTTHDDAARVLHTRDVGTRDPGPGTRDGWAGGSLVLVVLARNCFLVKFDDEVANLLRLIDDMNRVDVFVGDVVRGEDDLAHPVDHSGPIRFAEEDHRKTSDLFSLY